MKGAGVIGNRKREIYTLASICHKDLPTHNQREGSRTPKLVLPFSICVLCS